MPSIIVNFILWMLLLPAAIFATNQYKRKQVKIVKNPILWIGVILSSLLIGLRWDDGGDYANYFSIIADVVEGNFELDRLELIPRYLDILIHQLGLPFYTWFIFMALVQLVFMILIANNGYERLTPWIFLLYIYSLLTLSMIITRQVVALSVVLYAYTFISKKKLVPYLLFVALGYCFHRTALLCIPLYWILPRINLKSIPLQLGIVIAALISGDWIVNNLWSLVQINEEFRYSHYADAEFIYGTNSGFGVIANYIRYFLIILYSNKLKSRYEGTGFSVFYALTFIDACLYYSFKDDLALSRFEMYFSVAELITSAFLFHYLWRSKKQEDRVVFWGLLLIVFVKIVYTAYMGADWQFVWNVNIPSRWN